jgi:hypothetical protein
MIGSDLTDSSWDHGGTPEDILTTITHGLIDRGMPPWREVLGDEKMALLVAYILSHQPASARRLYDTNAAHAALLRDWLAAEDEMPWPAADEPPRLLYLPLRLAGGELLEAIGLLHRDGLLVLYDQATFNLHSVWAEVALRRERGALRGFHLQGRRLAEFPPRTGLVVFGAESVRFEVQPLSLREVVRSREGITIRVNVRIGSDREAVLGESFSFAESRGERVLQQILSLTGLPAGLTVVWPKDERVTEIPASVALTPLETTAPSAGTEVMRESEGVDHAGVPGSRWERIHRFGVDSGMPRVRARALAPIAREDPYGGSRQRPGYRAMQYPLPRLPSSEDRLMPFALTAHAGSGALYLASGKSGEIFSLRTDTDAGDRGQVRDFAGAHFQDVLAMGSEGAALLVQHRRGLTRVSDQDGDGLADRFERILDFPQQLDPKSYDWGYGMVRDQTGGYLLSFAGHAPGSQHIVGAGSVIRLVPKASRWTVHEVAFGVRNPVGWTSGPSGDIFFSDNQGNWMASNRLSALVPGSYYGFPNPKQPEHSSKPVGPTAVWIPYGWAKSINGVAYDSSGGKFGPFDGQFFLAELMEGGAIIRAQVEKVKDQYQGACFPFWGRGLLGPVAMTFDSGGRLWVGSITEPGWMRQPDRGALYAIEYTGEVPFEIQSIHARPTGFRLQFTLPPNRRAKEAISYRVEHYRYNYSSAYGSSELDRTPVSVESVSLLPDGRTVELGLGALVRGRIYRFDIDLGLTSQRGEPLANGHAAYTLNEIPD